MWADNETRIDLLGFDYLVDALELVLTDPKMLPVTVGVAGDWGSGKTSLMRMAEDRLGGSEKVVTVSFSPWRFEGYDDMKPGFFPSPLLRRRKWARFPSTWRVKRWNVSHTAAPSH